MDKKDLCFHMVNVNTYDGGYSFMVSTTDSNISTDEIIEKCSQKDLFTYAEDADCADTTDLVSEYDIKHFEKIGCMYNID